MKKQKQQIIDGRYQLGIVYDWIMREGKCSVEARALYMEIAFFSLNVYHKRKVAIAKDKLSFKSRRLYKYRDELVALGYIGWQNTKAYTLFWLEEPNYTLKKFKFSGDEKKKEAEVSTEADEDINF